MTPQSYNLDKKTYAAYRLDCTKRTIVPSSSSSSRVDQFDCLVATAVVVWLNIYMVVHLRFKLMLMMTTTMKRRQSDVNAEELVDVTRTYDDGNKEREDEMAAWYYCCCYYYRSCYNRCTHANGVNPQCNVQHNMSNNVKA
uniref:Uncharacterized protein n=1 Tax=Glossina brevipalpis TaxID=37001 RepID=A0A1A9WNA7_9MUSC